MSAKTILYIGIGDCFLFFRAKNIKKVPYIVEVNKKALAFTQQMWYDAYAEMRFCHLKKYRQNHIIHEQ